MLKEAHLERLADFLRYYDAVHADEGAYGFGEGEDPYREASENLYRQSIGFLETLPYDEIERVLDVGFGYGQHAAYFAGRGLDVVGVTAHLSEASRAEALAAGFEPVETDMHFLDLPDDSFDMVWSHHSLEHSFSPMLALYEWMRVLRPGGWLCVTVPPHKTKVVSGHFTTGWTIGQLMYMLGVMGYELSTGTFLREGYNVRALVRRPTEPVDPRGLSWLHILKDRLPDSIVRAAERHEWSPGRFQFEGDVLRVTPDEIVTR